MSLPFRNPSSCNNAQPIDKSDPDFAAQMALGIQFSYQAAQQYSTVDVNGMRLTSAAGDYDDGVLDPNPYTSDGLITVGGVGDSPDNPADPFSTTGDDELYNLAPYLNSGDTTIRLDTSNPSNDDSIFLVALTLAGSAGVNTLPRPRVVELGSAQMAQGIDFGYAQRATAPANTGPGFITAAPTTPIQTGQLWRYEAKATDPDGDALRYNLSVKPDGMVADPVMGTLTWQPTADQLGDHTVILNVQDGAGGNKLQVFQVTVKPENHAPIFQSVPETVRPYVGQEFRYLLQAVDPDADNLTFNLVSSATPVSELEVTPEGLLKWTPGDTTEQVITVKVTDGKGGEALQEVRLQAQSLPADNHRPEITSQPQRSVVRAGNFFFYQLAGQDPEGTTLSYRFADTPPARMLIDPQSGLVSWQPTVAQSGQTYTVRVIASDGVLDSEPQSIALRVVTYTAPNSAPAIESTPPLLTKAGAIYSYSPIGRDPDGDLLLWSLEQGPDGMGIDARTGQISWQSGISAVGEHQVRVKLTDHFGAEVWQEFSLRVTAVNAPPRITSTPLTSATQNTAYVYSVTATDPEDEGLSFSLGTKPDGMTIDDGGQIRWTPLSSQVGSQVVEVLVTDRQGGTTTQRFTLEVGTTPINHAPTITSAPVFLAVPGHAYTYQVQASDADAGDTLTYQLLKAPEGVTINATTGKVEWASPIVGTYQIVVGAVDSQGVGAAQGFTLTVRENHAPVINSTAPETAALGTTYRYDVRATDADGDRLLYALDQVSTDRGMAIDALGRLVWSPKQEDLGQTYSVTISVADEQGAITPQTFSLSVAQDTQAPNITVFATQDPIDVGSTVTLIARATDNVSVANLTLIVDGKAVVLDANGRATVTLDHTGDIQAIATATDSSNNQNSATTTIHVIDPHANFDPTLSFDFSSLKDGVITAPTDLIGTVEGSGITRYELAIAPVSGGEFKTIFTGTGPVDDGVLGKFDPSLLENDTYTVKLTAFDANGNSSSIEDTINVAGDLKLGNFRLSFTDLSIPVTGIPITLTRTYDSLTSNTTDGFGYGWRMEFRDTDLRTSLKRTPEEELTGAYPAFKVGTRVYITLPGGKREGFTFEPTPDRFNTFFGNAPEAAMYHPAFKGDKGVTSTLTVRDTRIVRSSDTNQYVGLAGNPYNPADPTYGGVYVLTTKDGIVYEIDAQTGDLLTVTDTNGNKLTYTDASITSSTGQQVTFERDAQNRITSVKDPMGELVRYTYDAKGDLVSVSDRESNTTHMEYNSDHPHYLDKIIDLLGHTGVKTEYDENGRLKQMVDANGKSVGIDYDPANSLETVTDQLGHKTTYEYDSRGNVVTEVDAEGKITKRTYNDNNDVLEETVISDRSDNPLTPELEGFTTKYTYDDSDNKLTETDALGHTTYYTYGALNRLLTETDALGRTTPTPMTVRAI